MECTPGGIEDILRRGNYKRDCFSSQQGELLEAFCHHPESAWARGLQDGLGLSPEIPEGERLQRQAPLPSAARPAPTVSGSRPRQPTAQPSAEVPAFQPLTHPPVVRPAAYPVKQSHQRQGRLTSAATPPYTEISAAQLPAQPSSAADPPQALLPLSVASVKRSGTDLQRGRTVKSRRIEDCPDITKGLLKYPDVKEIRFSIKRAEAILWPTDTKSVQVRGWMSVVHLYLNAEAGKSAMTLLERFAAIAWTKFYESMGTPPNLVIPNGFAGDIKRRLKSLSRLGRACFRLDAGAPWTSLLLAENIDLW